MGSLKQAFEKWHGNVNNMVHRENILRHCKERLSRASVACAFARWKETLSLRLQYETNVFIQDEQKVTADATNLMSINRAKHVKVRDESHRKRAALAVEIDTLNTRSGKVVNSIINKNDVNVFISRKRAILLEWFKYTINRRKCYRLLTLAITRTLQMNGFNAIRNVSRGVLKE
jgi:hypothetical protein